MSFTDSQIRRGLIRLERDSAYEPMERVTGASVRKILWLSATRARNLAFVGTACISALLLLGFGLGWAGLMTLGVGALGYGSLIAKDTVSESFLRRLNSIGGASEPSGLPPCEEEEEPPFDLSEVDYALRHAYLAVDSRRLQLQEVLSSAPALLWPSLSEVGTLCERLLVNARRLVRRGQRLHGYLGTTKLVDLRNSICEALLQIEATSDPSALRSYRQIVSGRRAHIETHMEVDGLYERVFAQLSLIEATLAGAAAKLVRICAADDEESALTASALNEELGVLTSEVLYLESSLEEVSRDPEDEKFAEYLT